MKILMLSRYARQGANSRYRLFQYIPGLEAAGHEVRISPMLGDEYLRKLYSTGKRLSLGLVRAYAGRIAEYLRVGRYDVVILDQEFLPYLPGACESLLAHLQPRMVVDYDDAAYVKYSKNRLLEGKIPTILRNAAAIVVGNEELRKYAERFSDSVSVIPTVVDTRKYPVRQHVNGDTVRVVWVGTPVTAREYLPEVVPALRVAQDQNPKILYRFIGTGNIISPTDLRCELLPWTEASEATLIAESDIGIMPLPDTEAARGKCALKLIQYMAAGLPVVASPVGANRTVVNEGVTGYFARTAEDWSGQLLALSRDPGLRSRMGAAGRARAEEQFSLETGLRKWQSVLAAVVDGDRKAAVPSVTINSAGSH